MKRNAILNPIFIISGCLLLFACGKDIVNSINERRNPGSHMLESAGAWHLQHLQLPVNDKSYLSPIWKDSWVSENDRSLLIVPAPEHNVNNPNFSIRRFLIFRVSGNKVVDGRIVEFLGEKYNVNDNIDLLVKQYDSTNIPNFNGAVLQYDVNYNFITSAHYSNGMKDKSTVRIISKTVKSLQTMTEK